MSEKATVTVILPLHRLDSEPVTTNINGEDRTVQSERDYFASAVASVREQKVLPDQLMIVIPKGNEELKKDIEEYNYGDKIKGILNIVENDGETDFCSQVNYGVSQLTTDWFTVLEVDDVFSTIWLDNFHKYQQYHDDVDAFLPIVLDTDIGGNFLHFTNEPVWAKDFSDSLGQLDNDSLLNFPNFQIVGAVYNKEAFESVGGLKPSIILQFGYELLLRLTYYDKKIMTIPKIGYKKTNMRPNALFHGYYHSEENKMDPVEARWWFNTARKECYFKNDRGIKYEVNETV